MTDERLMAAYIKGDVAAFQTLYQRHHARVLGYLVARLSSQEAAEDVFQEVFEKLHRYRFRYSEEIPFIAWLFTIARNACIDHLRRQRVRAGQLTNLPEEIERAADTSEAPLEIADAIAELDSLPPQQREALELRFNNGLTFVDIAARMALSPANARQIVSRAVKRLRALIVDKERNDESA